MAILRTRYRTVLVTLVLLVAAAGACTAWLLGTDRGRQSILDAVSGVTASPGFRLELHGLRLGGTWELDGLSIRDASGQWLRAENIALRPVLGDLLKGTVTLEHLGIGLLDVERLPSGGETTGGGGMPRLRILSIEAGHIRLGQALAGREALLSLRGGMSLDAREIRAGLRAARLDRQGDVLDLDGRVDLRLRSLDLRLDLHEAPEGLLHTLLGLGGDEGIALSVSGQGPFEACPITLDAQVSDAADLAGNATIDLEGGPKAQLQARLTPGAAWTGLTGLPAEVLDLDARVAWQDPVLRATDLNLRSALAELQGNATWDSAAGALEAAGELRSRDLDALMPDTVTAGPASGRFSLHLTPAGLHAELLARLASWRVSGTDVAEARADLTLEMPAALDSWQTRASLEALLPTLPEGMRSWAGNATLGGDFRFVSLDSLRLESDKLGLDFDGRIADGIALDARADLRNLPLPGLARGVSGRLTSELRGKLDGASLTADMTLDAADIEGLPGAAGELFGRDARMKAAFTASPENISVRDASLESRTAVEMRGEIDPRTLRFEATFNARLPRLAADGLSLENGASLSGTAAGTPSAFAMDLQSDSPRIVAAGLDLYDLRAEAALKGLPERPELTLRAGLTAAGQPADLELAASLTDDGLRIARSLFELPGTALTATGELNTDSLLFSGQADLRCDDLRVPGRILGLDLGGALNLRAGLTGDRGVQGVRFEATGRSLSLPGASIGQADLRGATAWPGLSAATDAKMDLTSVSISGLPLDRIRGTLRGDGEGLGFGLDMNHAETGTDIETRGTFAITPARLRIDALDGALLQERLRLESPLDITVLSDGTQWQESVLTFGQAKLTSRGSIARERIDVTADLRDMNTASLRRILPSLPDARVGASLRVQGSPTAPDALLEARADAIRLGATGLGNIPELGATAEMRLRNGQLESAAAVTAPGYVDLNARFSCPVQTGSGALEISDDAPLSGRLGGRTNLDILPRVLRLDDQAVNGTCELDFRIEGPFSAPRLSGAARVRGGRYENFRSGTAVVSADVDVRALGTVLELGATGTDGGEGRVAGRGTVDLDALSYDFAVDLANFHLLRLDMVNGNADGSFRFHGDLDAANLTGSLTLDPATVILPRPAAAEAPIIEIRETNTGTAGKARKRPADHPFLVAMDLNVGMPARLSVAGRGLDSEWSGRLHVGGDHVRPIVTGDMTLMRGTFLFLDRIFTLTKGTLTLGGEDPPNPFLDILGEANVLETLVQVQLSGPARSLRLSLTSTPALPQDELLAMILFGRSMSEISPLQAALLAQAAAEMTGTGIEALAFLNSIKSKLGLQEVDVTDDGDDTSVGVGGYVGGKYYIRTQRSVSGQDKTKVEVQLTPKISVETEIGADSRQGGGVNWKHDY